MKPAREIIVKCYPTGCEHVADVILQALNAAGYAVVPRGMREALEKIANHSTDDSDVPHTVEAMQAFARAALAGTAPQGMRELRKCLDEYEAAWGAALQLSAIADTEPERQAAKIKASSLYGRCVEIRAALGLSSEKGQGL